MLAKITKQIKGRRTRRPLLWCGQLFLALKTNGRLFEAGRLNEKGTTLLNDSFNSACSLKYIFSKTTDFFFLTPNVGFQRRNE